MAWHSRSARISAVSAQAMPCPQCQGEMSAGVVVGRSPGVKFKRARGLTGDLTGIQLTKGFFNRSVDALRCETCGTVVIPGRRV
jgi:hypothetical protein